MLVFNNWDSTTGSSMAEATRMLGMNKLTVHANAGNAPPPASARGQRMTLSAGDGWGEAAVRLEEDEKERAVAWKYIQQLRGTYANIGVCKSSTVQGMTECPDGD